MEKNHFFWIQISILKDKMANWKILQIIAPGQVSERNNAKLS